MKLPLLFIALATTVLGQSIEHDCYEAGYRAAHEQQNESAAAWSAHYNRAERRCLIRFTFQTPTKDLHGKQIGTIWIVRLDDGFEHAMIAYSQTVTGYTWGVEASGWIPSRSVTPEKAMQFIDAKMGY